MKTQKRKLNSSEKCLKEKKKEEKERQIAAAAESCKKRKNYIELGKGNWEKKGMDTMVAYNRCRGGLTPQRFTMMAGKWGIICGLKEMLKLSGLYQPTTNTMKNSSTSSVGKGIQFWSREQRCTGGQQWT